MLICAAILVIFPAFAFAQDPVTWLSDYSGDITDGSSTLNYSFSTVDGNDCKIRIEEKETDKKGRVSLTSHEFYLSDLNPEALSFRPTGKVIEVSLKIKNDQKFMTVSEDGEFTGYDDEVGLTMNEVDKARSFIDAIKEHTTACRQTDRAWNSTEEALDWLTENVTTSENSGTTYDQTFSRGAKPYLATLLTGYTDNRGTAVSILRTIDLGDIDPQEVSLHVSGKSLKVEVPVKDRNYFIAEKNGEGEISFSRDMEIHADDIELARNIVNAMVYLASNTRAERPAWNSYAEALNFVKSRMGNVTSGGDTYDQSMDFDGSPSGTVIVTYGITDSRGTSSKQTSTFYPADIQVPVELNASSRGAYLELNTIDKEKYIKRTEDGNPASWDDNVRIYVDDIDLARDLGRALEYAVGNSSTGDAGLNNVEKINEWIAENVDGMIVDGDEVKQVLSLNPGLENKLILEVTTVDAEGTTTSEKYEVYPEDLSAEDNVLEVSGTRLYVPLSTGRESYIRHYKDGALQSYTRTADIYFDDVQSAKYFTDAMRYLIGTSKVESREMKSAGEAWAFLKEHIRKVEVNGDVYDQSVERPEADNPCKVKLTRNETDSRGSSAAYDWEFMVSDIDPAGSKVSVSSREVRITLATKDGQKLIKPYKNGEAQNFDDEVVVQADDMLEARKILGAFVTLGKQCK